MQRYQLKLITAYVGKIVASDAVSSASAPDARATVGKIAAPAIIVHPRVTKITPVTMMKTPAQRMALTCSPRIRALTRVINT